MRKAIIYQFSLPIESSRILRQQKLKTRDGFLIHLQENNFQGWGEISPLPEFSVETLEMLENHYKQTYMTGARVHQLKSAIFHQWILGLVVRRLN